MNDREILLEWVHNLTDEECTEILIFLARVEKTINKNKNNDRKTDCNFD
jgi:hypothetical protein